MRRTVLGARRSVGRVAPAVDRVGGARGGDHPADFEDRLVASTGKPIALAFTPDGRMLIATQPGQLRVYKNGTLLQTSTLNISSKICTTSERGMLGAAVDPNFSTNHYVYLLYT